MNNLNNYIDALYQKALSNFSDKLDLNYIKTICEHQSKRLFYNGVYESFNGNEFKLNEQMIEKHLKKKGFILNVVTANPVWVKGFLCVSIGEKHIDMWIDKQQNAKVTRLSSSHLTGLQIMLDYFNKFA